MLDRCVLSLDNLRVLPKSYASRPAAARPDAGPALTRRPRSRQGALRFAQIA